MEEQKLCKRVLNERTDEPVAKRQKLGNEQLNEVNVPFPNETQELVTKSLQTTNEEHSKKTAGERNEGIGKVGVLKHMEEREKEIEEREKEREQRKKEIEEREKAIEEREKAIEEREKEREQRKKEIEQIKEIKELKNKLHSYEQAKQENIPFKWRNNFYKRFINSSLKSYRQTSTSSRFRAPTGGGQSIFNLAERRIAKLFHMFHKKEDICSIRVPHSKFWVWKIKNSARTCKSKRSILEANNLEFSGNRLVAL